LNSQQENLAAQNYPVAARSRKGLAGIANNWEMALKTKIRRHKNWVSRTPRTK
jgi:hypothetical protein